MFHKIFFGPTFINKAEREKKSSKIISNCFKVDECSQISCKID